MKIFKTIVLFFLLATPMALMAEDTALSTDLSPEMIMEMGVQGHATEESDSPVRIEYLLDSEGRPYIISIWSNDEDITRMIRKMINNGTEFENKGDDQWLAITFYYNNIR